MPTTARNPPTDAPFKIGALTKTKKHEGLQIEDDQYIVCIDEGTVEGVRVGSFATFGEEAAAQGYSVVATRDQVFCGVRHV